MGKSCLLVTDYYSCSTIYTKSKKMIGLCLIVGVFMSGLAQAQSTNIQLDQVRWKSESDVRDLLGEPETVHGPIGTHANYVLWKYEDVTVAFANGRVFHLFDKNSLKKFELGENR